MSKVAIGINKKSGIYIVVTNIFTKEKKGYVVECPELGIYSQGDTLEEAEENILDALKVFLNSIEELNLRDNIFKDKNIKLYKYKQIPKEEKETITISPNIEENSFYRKVPIAI